MSGKLRILINNNRSDHRNILGDFVFIYDNFNIFFTEQKLSDC